MRKADQRSVCINSDSLEEEVARFQRDHHFAANAAENDMWVSVDLGDLRSEEKALTSIKATLAERYKRFRNADVQRHC